YDPFAGGYLRLVASNADTLVQMDRDGLATGAGWVTVATLTNVAPSSLTPENLGFGTSAADIFHLDTQTSGSWNGLSGDDVFYFGGSFSESMAVIGGFGNDTVVVQGPYLQGLKVNAGGLGGVETLSLL